MALQAKKWHDVPHMTEPRIKVVLVAPLPPPVGGIATWTRLLLAVPADADIDRLHVDTSIVDGYNARVRLVWLWRQARLAARVCWRLVSTRPDVAHVATSYLRGWWRDVFFLRLARLTGAATVVNLHGGDFEHVFKASSRVRQRSFLAQFRQAAAVVAITEETARFLRGLGLSNVHFISNCIDVRPQPPEAPQRRSLDRWLFVGYVVATKGVPEAFEALRQFPNAHLTLIGPVANGTSKSAELLSAALSDPEIKGRITHLGGISSEAARAAYANHDLFVFPTRREGFPNVVLEAMEAGLPIVASRVGGIPEMLIDGEHGLLVDSGDQAALNAAIGRVSADPEWAAQLGAAARARAVDLYEVGNIGAAWCRLYREAAAR